MRSRSFTRRFTPGHPGFEPLKQANQNYKVEKLIGDTWILLGSGPTAESCLRLASNVEGECRVVRTKDGEVIA